RYNPYKDDKREAGATAKAPEPRARFARCPAGSPVKELSMRTSIKAALGAVGLGSALLALAACGSSGYYRTSYYDPYYYNSGYAYGYGPSYVTETPTVAVAPTTTVVTAPTVALADDCIATYRPAYCGYPRFSGSVVINGVMHANPHFREGRFGREFW